MLLHAPARYCRYLPWQERLRILLGASLGLSHLHETCGLAHRDVRASNVGLDALFRAQLLNCGLSVLSGRPPAGSKRGAGPKAVVTVDASGGGGEGGDGGEGGKAPVGEVCQLYSAAHDIFALGAVMLEVGSLGGTCSMQSINAICSTRPDARRSTLFVLEVGDFKRVAMRSCAYALQPCAVPTTLRTRTLAVQQMVQLARVACAT